MKFSLKNIQNNLERQSNVEIILSLIILLLLSLMIYFTQFNPFEDTTNSSSVYSEPETIIYQVDSNYPPFSFANEGDLIGFDFALTNIIFPSYQYKLDYSTDTWDKVYQRIVNREIDLAGVIGVTDERKKDVLYTHTLFNSYVSLFTLHDFGSISVDDLSNLKVGVGKGYYTESILRDELQIDYIAYSNIHDAILDLQNKKIDVIFENSYLIRNILIKQNLSGMIIDNVSNLYPREHAYAVSKDRQDLVDFMNNRIDELQANGTFESIYQSYFYEHSNVYYEELDRERWAIGLISAFGILIIIIVLAEIIKRLKSKLSLKVYQLEETNKELQEKYIEIRTLAYINMVTGLPNRNQLRHDISEMIKESHTQAVMMSVDIDHFNEINDAFGHAIGDIVLKEISERFKKIVPPEGKLYNVNGEEFVFVGRPINREIFKQKAKEVINELRKPIFASDNEIRLNGGIGVILYPEHGCNFDELMRNLDIAMMQAKRSKNEMVVFEEKMGLEFIERTELHKSLRLAIDNREFVLYYQPIIELDTHQIKGFEALVRWIHPIKGIQAPSIFIPAAEESRLIIPLTHWILEESFTFIKDINERFNSNYSISINISSIHIIQDDFIDTITQILSKVGLIPTCIEFEITESVFLNDLDLAITRLHQLQNFGIKISIDDFGTGYSSLSYLKDLPLDNLKIDKSFINAIQDSDKNLSLAESIVSLGHTLQLKLVAEGVENEAQLKLLEKLKCDYIQGYLLSKPLNSNDLIKYIQEKTQ